MSCPQPAATGGPAHPPAGDTSSTRPGVHERADSGHEIVSTMADCPGVDYIPERDTSEGTMLRRTFIRGSAALALAASTGMLMTVARARRALAAGAAAAVIPEHPRLMLRDFEAVRTLVANDSSAAAWYAKVKADADTIRTLPVSKYEIPDGLRLLNTSREVVRRTYSLALTHALEGDPAYAERLWQELEAVSKFPDWNSQRHFLDTAEMTH